MLGDSTSTARTGGYVRFFAPIRSRRATSTSGWNERMRLGRKSSGATKTCSSGGQTSRSATTSPTTASWWVGTGAGLTTSTPSNSSYWKPSSGSSSRSSTVHCGSCGNQWRSCFTCTAVIVPPRARHVTRPCPGRQQGASRPAAAVDNRAVQ